jgi:hypothetical protein
MARGLYPQPRDIPFVRLWIYEFLGITTGNYFVVLKDNLEKESDILGQGAIPPRATKLK